MESRAKPNLEDILSDKQICHILSQTVKEPCQLVGYDLKPASEGISGFLAEHFKLILHVEEEKVARKIYLFVKTIPIVNKPKAEFVDGNHYFKREALMFKLIKEINGGKGPNPYCTPAYIYTENLVVMPDLSAQGYQLRPFSEYLDLKHVLCTVKSMAQFHAAITNYLTERNFDTNQLPGFEYCLKDPTFQDSPWLRAGVKLTVNFLKEFSDKYRNLAGNLEEKLLELYIQACNSLTEMTDTLNLLIHKDLWINNIMFKYTNGTPTNAIIIDYQLTRYAPPAFDMMICLYLTTSRSFRERNENYIFDYYFQVFSYHLDEPTKQRMKEMKYDREMFQGLCEKARMFGLLEAVTTFPYVLMEPKTAQDTFDNPETYAKHLGEDRSEPVLAFARQRAYYRNMQLEVCEEFMERFLIK